MSLHLILPPTDEVVSVDEAKAQLRITEDTHDSALEAVIAAVVAILDPGHGGWLGRALSPQRWELRLDSFPTDEIELPYPPFVGMVSFVHDDDGGVEQSLQSGVGYRVINQSSHGKAKLAPIYGGSWPSVRSDYEAVRIRYDAGYDSYQNEMPANIRHAIHLLVRELWSLGEQNLFVSSVDVPGVESRSYTVSENAGRVLQKAAQNLLWTHRVIM